MNKRQAKKEYRKPLGHSIYFNCPNWNGCCPDQEEPCIECGFHYALLARKAFSKMLKREGFSISGWKLTEMPAKGFFIFYQKKKHKEITLETDDNKVYAITVYDFHSCTNIEYKSMAEALKSPCNNYIYAPTFHKNGTRNGRNKIKLQYYLKKK